MKALRGGRALPAPVHEAKARWMEAIQNVQAKRKDEIMNAAAEAAAAGKPAPPPPPPVLLQQNHHYNRHQHQSLADNGANGMRGVEEKGKSESFQVPNAPQKGSLTSIHLSVCLPDILALSEGIRGLSAASKRVRCAMWSALQLTILLGVDRELAVGDRAPDDDHVLHPETVELEAGHNIETSAGDDLEAGSAEGGKELWADMVEKEEAAA